MKSTSGFVVVRGWKSVSAATEEEEKWIVCGDDEEAPAVLLSMFFREISDGIPFKVISTAVLMVSLVH